MTVVSILAVGALLLAGTLGLAASPMGESGPEVCVADAKPEAPAPRIPVAVEDLDAARSGLYVLYEGMPGFVDVYFYPEAGVSFHPTFIGSVPEAARLVQTEVPVAFDVLPGEPQPAGDGPVPDQNDILCPGIRPGARIVSGGSVCTLSFILTDGQSFYAATAGHCIGVGQSASLDFGGSIGEAVYSTGDGGVGNDFALIKVRGDKEHLVDAEMCTVAGPTGMHGGGTILGQATVQTGHGLGAVPAFLVSSPPRAKPGVGVGVGDRSFTWQGSSVPGDSGSAIRLASGDALGVVTHLGIPVPTLNFGTRLDWGMQSSGLANLELVTVPYTHP